MVNKSRKQTVNIHSVSKGWGPPETLGIKESVKVEHDQLMKKPNLAW